MKKLTLLLVLFAGLNLQEIIAQVQGPEDSLSGFWKAQWISHPDVSRQDYAVFHFRRTFELASLPADASIFVSGDNRYRLMVNGQWVGEGPTRGDLLHWNYETYPLAGYLKPGKNVIAAVVWNFGEQRPVFQQSLQTAFICQVKGLPAELNTGAPGWKVLHNTAYQAETAFLSKLRAYFVVGPGERLNGQQYPWGWDSPSFDDRSWLPARNIARGQQQTAGTISTWGLQPSALPAMASQIERPVAIRQQSGFSVPGDFVKGLRPFTLPPQTECRILMDQSQLTNAYPMLTVSGGKGSTITATYAESLYLKESGHDKGNRNEVEGKFLRGMQDVWLPDGGQDRSFTTLWFRTYRYLELHIKTGSEPLTVTDFHGRFTGYPFEEKAGFTTTGSGRLPQVWEAGWRTARLCAGETYYDCPYYEQMQYVGDTRIQALISLYVSGDDRLVRQAIDAYRLAGIPEGLTQSRYPSREFQVIPTYSLFWVNMVRDYWMHREDPAFVKLQLPQIRNVLDWFLERRDPATGLVGTTGYWNFVDWSWDWNPALQNGGVPDLVGGSSILSLQLAYALQEAAELFKAFGQEYLAKQYMDQAAQLRLDTWRHCWNADRQLFSDTPAGKAFSQHANILAVLTGAVPGERIPDLVNRMLSDKSLTPATFYFQFYLFEVLQMSGMADRYLPLLDPWREMLDVGLTTFGENPDPTRSDCHAWSASPNYHLLSLVAGIRPSAPGFSKVRIAPSPGDLPDFMAWMPHPAGMIRVDWKKSGTNWECTVELPAGLNGSYHWNGKQWPLKPGKNALRG